MAKTSTEDQRINIWKQTKLDCILTEQTKHFSKVTRWCGYVISPAMKFRKNQRFTGVSLG